MISAGKAVQSLHLPGTSQPTRERPGFVMMKHRRHIHDDMDRRSGRDVGWHQQLTGFSWCSSQPTASRTTSAFADSAFSIQLMEDRTDAVMSRQARKHAFETALKKFQLLLPNWSNQRADVWRFRWKAQLESDPLSVFICCRSVFEVEQNQFAGP